MKRVHAPITRSLVVILAALGVLGVGSVDPASATSRVVVTASADIRVWVDDTYDVFPSYDDVFISLRADRDCYATVFVVDTDGFVHVVHPLSPRDNAWVHGGRTYRYTAFELGLSRLHGRGVAHVFAIASPYPFDYSPYGDDIFAGGCGYRIYGDPFVACREIYFSLLPASCRWDVVGVSFARFYIREWARYPHYLCRGHAGVHVRVGDYCSSCAYLYDGYRLHVADPYVVIHPRVKFREPLARYAEVKRSTVKYKSVERERTSLTDQTATGARVRETRRDPVVVESSGRPARAARVATKERVVSTSSGREAVAGWTKKTGDARVGSSRVTASKRTTTPPTIAAKKATGNDGSTRAKNTPAKFQTRSKTSAASAPGATRAQEAKKGAKRSGGSSSKKAR